MVLGPSSPSKLTPTGREEEKEISQGLAISIGQDSLKPMLRSQSSHTEQHLGCLKARQGVPADCRAASRAGGTERWERGRVGKEGWLRVCVPRSP